MFPRISSWHGVYSCGRSLSPSLTSRRCAAAVSRRNGASCSAVRPAVWRGAQRQFASRRQPGKAAPWLGRAPTNLFFARRWRLRREPLPQVSPRQREPIRPKMHILDNFARVQKCHQSQPNDISAGPTQGAQAQHCRKGDTRFQGSFHFSLVWGRRFFPYATVVSNSAPGRTSAESTAKIKGRPQ